MSNQKILIVINNTSLISNADDLLKAIAPFCDENIHCLFITSLTAKEHVSVPNNIEFQAVNFDGEIDTINFVKNNYLKKYEYFAFVSCFARLSHHFLDSILKGIIQYPDSLLTTKSNKDFSSKFDTRFFVINQKMLSNTNLPSFLYTLNGCNYSWIFKTNSMVALDDVVNENPNFECTYLPKDTYYHLRNQLIVKSLYNVPFDDKLLKSLRKSINMNIRLLRYNYAKALVFALKDFMLGRLFFESIDPNDFDVDLNRINYFLLNENELELHFNEDEFKKDSHDLPLKKKIKRIVKKFIFFKGKDIHYILDIDNPYKKSGFLANKILYWDIPKQHGFICYKDNNLEKDVRLLAKLTFAKYKKFNHVDFNRIELKVLNKEGGFHHNFIEYTKPLERKYKKIQKEKKRNQKLNLPIERKVVFSVGTRLGFTCNPKYVLEEFIKIYGNHFSYVWIAHKPELCNPNKYENLKVISLKNTKEVIKELETAHIIVYDDMLPATFAKRDGQILINTWHGSINYKKIGTNSLVFNNEIEKKLFEIRNPKPDVFVGASRAFIESTSRSFNFPPEIFCQTGSPRNSSLFYNDAGENKATKQLLGIAENQCVIFYAPTFRNDNKADLHGLDVKSIVNSLQKRTNKKWVFLYRGHPFTVNFWTKQDHVIDVSNYPDQNDLLKISNIVISDYSSILWDSSIRYIPTFRYCPDYYEYNKNERGFEMDFLSLPYPLAFSNEELIKNIERFDQKIFNESVDEHFNKCGSFESESSCKKLFDFLLTNDLIEKAR